MVKAINIVGVIAGRSNHIYQGPRHSREHWGIVSRLSALRELTVQTPERPRSISNFCESLFTPLSNDGLLEGGYLLVTRFHGSMWTILEIPAK